jgi:hypothetical protein
MMTASGQHRPFSQKDTDSCELRTQLSVKKSCPSQMWMNTTCFVKGGNVAVKPSHQGSSPNSATPVCVPTNTFPFTITGVMNLFPLPKLSRAPAAWLLL